MKFISTSQPSTELTLVDAVLRVPDRDGGIVLAEKFPVLPKAVLANIAEMSIDETAYIILSSLLGRDIALNALNALVRRTFTFDFPFRATEEPHVYNLNLLTGSRRSHHDLSARFYAGLADMLHPSGKPAFVSCVDDPYQQSLRTYLGMTDSRLIILCPHDKTEATVESLRGCSSRHIYILSLTGSEENRRSMLDSLMNDSAFINRNNLVFTDRLNTASYLPLTIVYFASVAPLRRLEPNLRTTTLIMNRTDEGVLLAAAVARAMGLRIRFFVRENSGTVTERLRQALKRLGTDPDKLTITPEQEKASRAQANMSSPVVIVDIPELDRASSAAQHGQRHRFYHVVRNSNTLRKEIEIIK